MKHDELFDLYSDYLISSFGATTATGLSTLLEGDVSHDQVTRVLASRERTSTDLWQMVKPHVREVQSPDGVMIIDDSIAEKPYSDENEIVCWHYDHSKQAQVKGINFMTMLYHSRAVSLPVGFTLIAKTEVYFDKEGNAQRRSPIGKNEYYRAMLQQAVTNQIPFRYVMNDSWYSSAENMRFVKQTLAKDFIMPLKANRKIALSLADKCAGKYVRVDALDIEPNTIREIYLEGVEFPLLFTKHVIVNEDGSRGVQYLVTSDLTLSADGIATLYRTRWHVEPYHKSLKQNASLAKSPTHTVRTQTNHFFAALCGYIKLELLKVRTNLNHFALKLKLYLRANQVAFDALRQLTPVSFAA
jgi:IS4 transposase